MTRALLLVFLPLLASAADVTGQWNLHLIAFGDEFAAARIELTAEGNRVNGTLNELKLDGTVEGDLLHMTATRPNGQEWGKFEGRVQGENMTGTVKRSDQEFAWKATRAPVRSAAPKTHVFEPTVFHRVFSGAIPPVLHINAGDTIKTTTVDAGGRDGQDVARSLGGNPETGPFFVEGAMPGDTLAVKFHRIRLNRDSAGSGNRIVSGAVDPGYYRDAKFDDKFNSEWRLDRQTGIAMLAKPTERLKNFQVKLQPMLGCVGVAPPAKQSFRSGWLGSWGGNMDYSGVREGVTVYLPVYQEGALLFVGDGHALEGDGELNGDALETSMDVEFTVDLIRGKSTQGPRFESDEYLMASGIAGSLQEALQGATTELARWLERDYKLSANESNIVLGTSIRYDIAEIVDPQVHVVAKVKKAVLRPLEVSDTQAKPSAAAMQVEFEPITLERSEQVAEPAVRVTKDGANTIVAIFAGEKRTGGYSVKVTGVEKRGDVCTVSYRIDAPPPGAIVTQAITYPHQAVRIHAACSKVEVSPPLPAKSSTRPDR